MSGLDTIKHLLPRTRAWNLTIDKQLRQFFEGLVPDTIDNPKAFTDLVFLDIFPETTRQLDEWEFQFGLPDTGLTDAARRDRLDGVWKAVGGQYLAYIQQTLQDAGFPVFVHEWWVPGTEPAPGVKVCVTPRDPRVVLRSEFTSFGNNYIVLCGEALAQCGEVFAEAGNALSPRGYPLVNKVLIAGPDVITGAGEAFMECGEALALCGNFFVFENVPIQYIVPDDPLKWPYFLYIGAETFGDLVTISPSRRDELEDLCLKICPTQHWLGMLVEYG